MGDSEGVARTSTSGVHRVPKLPFNGKPEGWTEWKLRLSSWMKLIGVWDVMSGKTQRPGTTAREAAARAEYSEKNSTAFTYIVTNVSGAAFNIVAQAPEDDGRAAWALLLDRYETKTRAQKINLLTQLMRIKLEGSQDPDELFTAINLIVKQLSHWENLRNIDNDWLIGITLNALPDGYKELITVLDNAKELTYDEAKDKIRAFYARQLGEVSKYSNYPGETVLLASSKKIVCYKCKKEGHKSNACRSWQARVAAGDSASGKWCSRHKTASHSDSECKAQQQEGHCAAQEAQKERQLEGHKPAVGF